MVTCKMVITILPKKYYLKYVNVHVIRVLSVNGETWKKPKTEKNNNKRKMRTINFSLSHFG